MVIAEALELDTGFVVLLVLISLGFLLGTAIVTGVLGVMVGIAIARRSQTPEARAALRRGSRAWVIVAGIGATLLGWIFFFSVGIKIVDDAWGLLLVWLSGLALAVLWGWWSAQSRRFDSKTDA